MAVPTTTKRWTVQGKGEFDNLSLDSRAEVPRLGDHDILVKFHAASLNYRDLIIVKVKHICFFRLPGLVV
jgi:NADPH:quinone reductase-like Zn-dependent oxidoreductase